LVCQFSNATGIWLIDPRDQLQAERVGERDDGELSIDFFGQFMEKGVIRRARMRFLLGHISSENYSLKAAYQDLIDSPLPLTA
jgi:hypothetical protein